MKTTRKPQTLLIPSFMGNLAKDKTQQNSDKGNC